MGLTHTGTEFPVEISLSPLQTKHGLLVMSIIRDITDRRHAEEQIQASLREKEALLREIHHRVKNNLQITSSLLRLQARQIDDERARALFDATQDRIRSMALVHEKLYQSTNLSRIDFAEYARGLVAEVSNSYGMDSARIQLVLDLEPLRFEIDRAIPCGLILNELLSNAFKYAFPDDLKGSIEVSFKTVCDGEYVLHIADNGVGLKASFEEWKAQITPQPASLFEIPAGFSKMDMGAMMRQGNK